MIKLILIIGLSLIISYGCIEACKCAQRHPQAHYCESQFAILVKVKKDKVDVDDQTIKYDVNVDYTYKATDDAEDILKHGELYTASNSAACGATLEKGQTYVVTGYVSEGKASIHTCGFIRLAKDITSTQRKGFNCSYKKGCDCTICLENYGCNTINKDKNCIVTQNQEDCFFSHSVCVNRNGICDWTKCAGFSGCVNP